ncbi:MAG: oligoendopeptidase F [Bacilli bacterium]|nr:oligoendopeptidase F [Bacilli bacterium]
MKRIEQNEKDTWDLAMMFDKNNLTNDLKEIDLLVNDLSKYETLELNKALVIEILEHYYHLLIKIENIYVYYSHQLDTDFNNSTYLSEFQYLEQYYNNLSTKTAFIMPKISQVTDEILNDIINDHDLVNYHKVIKDIIHNKKRFLSIKEEHIISSYGLIDSVPYQIFSSFSNADLKFKPVKDAHGKEYDLTEGTYSILIRDQDQTLRKNAFLALLKGYGEFNHTLATTYISELKNSYLSMKNRHYSSTLEQALEPKQISIDIYYNLLNTIENNLHINHQYLALRQEILGVESLHLYDVYVSLVPSVDYQYDYLKAQSLVKKALKIMPDEYQDVLNEAFSNRWIDVYENEGKRSGAYSGGSYLSNPYILLNYHNNINDVFTLIHELGHSLHSYFANKYNPYQNANYKIFVAEIASTVNELILVNYLLQNTDEAAMKKYLYNYLLEQFRTTLVRQTMFARFELEAHQLMEENKPLSFEVLNDLYYHINEQYFGDDMVIDEEIKYEYLRIPHFYYNYYVYQYATSFSIALNIVKRINNKETGFLDKYLAFLKLGDSLLPIDAIKTLDIDLTSSDIFESAMLEYQSVIELFKNVAL